MKRLSVFALMLLALLTLFLPLTAQELPTRSATVIDIGEVQVPANNTRQPADDSPTSGAGMGSLNHAINRSIARVASRHNDENAYTSLSEQRTTTAYVVVVRFENGYEAGIQTDSTDGLHVGQQVRIIGEGASARILR